MFSREPSRKKLSCSYLYATLRITTLRWMYFKYISQTTNYNEKVLSGRLTPYFCVDKHRHIRFRLLLTPAFYSKSPHFVNRNKINLLLLFLNNKMCFMRWMYFNYISQTTNYNEKVLSGRLTPYFCVDKHRHIRFRLLLTPAFYSKSPHFDNRNKINLLLLFLNNKMCFMRWIIK